ncbi:hypothetical protein [Ruegeria sp. 6PALISEP08]|uniref:hypothetical protein n=1 Tax=Ruegeria sp. 6PALISEP08 TaxID=1225660 RepID=UPI00067E91FF|nr:hypothetical protein [Ruegeria sp. 6PALISEP08]
MTDTPPTNTARPATWQDALHTGDVVAFRFPHETDGPNLPKVRPALVLDVEETDVGRFASLAYGTSNPRSCKAAYCVDVRSEKDRALAALHLPTRFDASRRILVSLDHPGFELHSEKGTPVLGRLSGPANARMHKVRARIHAERDIRRDYLGRQRRRAGGRRPVTVERRSKFHKTTWETINV